MAAICGGDLTGGSVSALFKNALVKVLMQMINPLSVFFHRK